MDTSYSQDVTGILSAIRTGDAHAVERLYRAVYDELHRMAERRLSGEHGTRTLSATALVHEAYLRLAGDEPGHWQNRAHFFSAAARAMRQILVDRARQRHSAKRGGRRERVSLSGAAVIEPSPVEELLDLDAALTRLEALDKRKADVVMLRFFAGLTVEETAQALDVSPATVKNEWSFARAWLHREMSVE